MKSKAGLICILLGILLIFGALSLFIYNRSEDNEAREAVASVMPQLVQQIKENTAKEETLPENDISNLQIPVEYLTEEDLKMTEIEIDGNMYIGFLSIPKLEIELPVMSGWDMNKLSIAPCRYYGSIRGENLVVMAHNYISHFGTIANLELGDSVFFTDMDGETFSYQVVSKDILDPSAVEEVISGYSDLTLFTCTYGGASRVTVYCDFTE